MKTIKLDLKNTVGQTVDIGQGEYRRRFDRAQQPFDVDEAEAAMLLKTGVFEKHVEQPPPPPTAEADKKNIRKADKE